MSWQAARNGLPGDTTAVDHASQVDQFLSAHGITPVYAGTQIVTPNGGKVGYGLGGINQVNLGISDVDQPFTMVGTTIGRVIIPLTAVGDGTDVTVSLCADSSGIPGSVLASTRVPASWLTQFGAPGGLAAGGPLALAQYNALALNDMTQVTWASPASGGFGAALPTYARSGDYLIMAGGFTPDNSASVSTVLTVAWQGGQTIGQITPQPPLPVATDLGNVVATTDTVLYVGGETTAASIHTFTAAVWAAGWSPDTGQISAWTAQAALPVALNYTASAAWGETVYIVGGYNAALVNQNTVYYATVTNGQLGAWSKGTPLPDTLYAGVCGVVGNWLVYIGGIGPGVNDFRTAVYYAPISSDGSIGAWLTGPPAPTAVAAYPGYYADITTSGIVIVNGQNVGGVIPQSQTLSFTADGPGKWRAQNLNFVPPYSSCAAFDLGGGQWQVVSVNPSLSTYWTGVMSSIPSISVPLPVSGLTNGTTYHLLVRQAGPRIVDSNSFESGLTAGTAITAGNSGGPAGRAFDNVTGTVAYDTAQAHTATLSAKVSMAAGTTSQVRWLNAADQAGNVGYIRFYLYLTSLPSANLSVAYITDHSSAFLMRVRIRTTGVVDLIDQNVAVMGTTVGAVATGRWVRIEAKVTCSATTGQGEVRVYNDADSTTATEDLTTTAVWNTGATRPGGGRWGGVTTAASSDIFWIEDVATSDSNWIGPTAPADDPGNYVTVALDPSALPTAAKTRPAGGGAWTTQPNGYAAMTGVYNQAAGGPIMHTWEDAGTRITTLNYAGAGGRFLGAAEATQFPDGTVLDDVTQVIYQGIVPVAATQLT